MEKYDVFNHNINIFNNDELQNNSNSLGMSIDIYQESINKTITEYLVNFEYLTRIMESYGFIIAPKEDLIWHDPVQPGKTDYDVEAAKKLIKESGFSNINMSAYPAMQHNASEEELKDVAKEVASMIPGNI